MKYLIYVTKADPLLVRNNIAKRYHLDCCYFETYETPLNGHIVAEFECDKVEEIKYLGYDCIYYTDTLDTVVTPRNPISSFEKESCLDYFELDDFLYNGKEKVGCAIHIKNLKAFDEPLKLNEVKTLKNQKAYEKALDEARKEDCKIADRIAYGIANDNEIANGVELTECTEWTYGLKRAPQNMCYVWYKGEVCVLISIRPQWVCKILNGEKTIEVRKKVLKLCEL